MSHIGIGLVGAGRIAGVHAEAYSSIPGARLVAVYDSAQERATALAGIHGASAAASLGQLLASEDVALVDVCTPTPTHLEAIEAALAAGKDIVTEKHLHEPWAREGRPSRLPRSLVSSCSWRTC